MQNNTITLKEKRDKLISVWTDEFAEMFEQKSDLQLRAAIVVAQSLLPRIESLYDDNHLAIVHNYLGLVEGCINDITMVNSSGAFANLKELKFFLDSAPLVTFANLTKKYPEQMKQSHKLLAKLDNAGPMSF